MFPLGGVPTEVQTNDVRREKLTEKTAMEKAAV
jgi:hypothetical protein